MGNGTDFQGALAFSTNSTGQLSFLNNILMIYKIDGDESGNFAGDILALEVVYDIDWQLPIASMGF